MSLLLVMFALMIVAGVKNRIGVCVVLTVLMIAVGANGETFPEVQESKELDISRDERDRLVGDYSTYNPAFRYYRAGNNKCDTCKLEFRDHPVVRMPEKRFYGCELFVLCNTDRVKL